MTRPRGKVELGTLFWLLVIGGAIYSAVIFLPVYADNFDVKEAVQAGFASQRDTDENIRGKINWMLRNTATHQEDDGFGNLVVKPGLELPPEQIVIERDDVAKMFSISVRYERRVQLKPLKKFVTLKFHEQKAGPYLQ